MPKETGIIMSGNHLDIIEGRKTMTRRTRGLEEINECPDSWFLVAVFQDGLARFSKRDGSQELLGVKCPYGGVGDRLWVRETWATENRYNHLKPREIPQSAKIFYLSDGGYSPFEMGKIRPSIFMPRWASRITLEITEVRAERLQEITEKDAIKEGFSIMMGVTEGGDLGLASAKYAFMKKWDSLNANRGYSWESNPWVWVISCQPLGKGENSAQVTPL